MRAKKHSRSKPKIKTFPTRLTAVVAISLAAVVGTLLLYPSHAISPSAFIESENGTLAGNVSTINDSAASGSKAIKFGSATSAQTCTNPTTTIPMDPNNPQAGVTLSGFYVTNDAWNASGYAMSETMHICNYNSWYITATANNNTGDGAVKTYPNTHQDFNSSPKISSFNTISSTFGESSPHVGIYEWAYDLWLNGVASSGSTEVMIWNDNFNQVPAGSLQATFSDGGRDYNVYRTSSGGYIAFVDKSNTTSGTVNILNFYKFLMSKGWIPSTSTIGQMDYGFELVSTNNQNARFDLTNFSLTVK